MLHYKADLNATLTPSVYESPQEADSYMYKPFL